MAVAFATLFLGLVVGLQPVELVPGAGVARVELLLDGAPVGAVNGPPWVVPCDFGEALAPHELVAVARDAEGRELGRARQWINLPRPQAEATLLVQGGSGGRGAVARLAWESLGREEPRSVAAVFDGRPLAVADPRAIPLPPHDPAQLHFLRVELEFSANLSAVAELVFGGAYQAEAATELTAVPVLLEGGRRVPPRERLAGWFHAGGRPVVPVAVEEGPAEVVVVMDRAAQEELWALSRRWAPRSVGYLARGGRGANPRTPGALEVPAAAGSAPASTRHEGRLGEGQVLRFLWPFSRSQDRQRVRYDLFARSEDHPPAHGGVLWLLTAAHQPPFSLAEQRLADAVAVAGMSASARGRRRAVVLVLSEQPADASRLTPAAVRGYLDQLRVPLFVWSVGEVSAAVADAWGEVRSVRRAPWFREAVAELSAAVARQRVVWLEGLHLPQRIALVEDAPGLRLVGPSGPPSPEPAAEQPATLAEAEILGAPAAFGAEGLEREALAVPAGSALRELPDPRSAALATVDAATELAVVERRGPWARVRYGALVGWVPAAGEAAGASAGPAGPGALVPRGADPELLGRALVHLGPSRAPAGRLGPFDFHTDLGDPGLASFLDRVAADLVRVYGERFGLEPDLAPGLDASGGPGAEAVVLFARETGYRAFAEGELALAGLEEGGFAGFGLAALYLGSRAREELASLLVHELGHLLNARALGPRTPPWLEEGLANDLAYAAIDPSGRLDPGALGGRSSVQRRLTGAAGREGWEVTVTTVGGRAALGRVAEALDRGALPPLAELTALTWRELVDPAIRDLAYAESAFFVRYLLESPRRAAGLRTYLASIAAGGPGEPAELLQALGEDWEALDRGFRRWLRAQALSGAGGGVPLPP